MMDFFSDIKSVHEKFPHLDIRLIQSKYNLGFGGGHNTNFDLCPGNIFWIQNNDIAFPHLDWLHNAITMLSDDNVGVIGPLNAPQTFSPYLCNGRFTTYRPSRNTYAEGSILLIRSNVFKEIGGFDLNYKWAMFEDSDLSMRIRQAGYRIEHLDMPHQHFRSSSFNTVPKEIRTTIMETNRAKFMARWNSAAWNGNVSGKEVFDLRSDGIGDIFAALPSVFSYARKNPKAQITINTNKNIWSLIPSLPNLSLQDEATITPYTTSDYDRISSIRNVNYSVPFNIGDLLAAALGVPPATPHDISSFTEALTASTPPLSQHITMPKEEYVLFHCESFRPGFQGRNPGLATFEPALKLLSDKNIPIVLLGSKEGSHRLSCLNQDQVIDLRGRTRLTDLVTLASNARLFLGIDSFPMHVAQCFRVPSVVVFGSLSPFTRLWDIRQSYVVQARDLDCLGCYHANLTPSIPHCLRGDEACLKNISSNDICDAVTAALAGTPPETAPMIADLRRWQAQHCLVHMQHPGLKSKVFSGEGVPLTQVTDLLYNFIGAVENQFDTERHDAHQALYTLAKEEASKKDREISQLQTALEEKDLQYTELAKLVSQMAIKNGYSNYKEAQANENGTSLCDLSFKLHEAQISFDEDKIIFKSTGNDPRIVIKDTFYVVEDMPFLTFLGTASSLFTLEVFYTPPGTAFSEERKRSIQIEGGSFNQIMRLPLKTGSRILLRIDPCNTPNCDIVLTATLNGLQQAETLPLAN